MTRTRRLARKVNEHIDLEFSTIGGLRDVAVSVLGSDDLSQWQGLTDQLLILILWLDSGRLQTIYRSIEPTTGNCQRYYRISARTLNENLE